jgi:hypothetical protein
MATNGMATEEPCAEQQSLGGIAASAHQCVARYQSRKMQIGKAIQSGSENKRIIRPRSMR